MRVRILIGVGALILVMLLLGFVALREPERMEAFSRAEDGRFIEHGAEIYDMYCEECHGVNGKAEACFNTSGTPMTCRGLPLNSYYLFCEDSKEEVGFVGTNAQFIEQTVAFGRPGTEMPSWSTEVGGPLSPDQIKAVTMFVLNWEVGFIECWEIIDPVWPLAVEDFLTLEFSEPVNFKIEPGNVERGQQVYEDYACSACHGSLYEIGSNTVGPWLGNLKETSSSRIEGVSAAQYVYESILDPNAFIVPDCPFGPCPQPSSMRGDYGSRFMVVNPQDMADLLVYLLGKENMPIVSGTPHK